MKTHERGGGEHKKNHTQRMIFYFYLIEFFILEESTAFLEGNKQWSYLEVAILAKYGRMEQEGKKKIIIKKIKE